VPQAAPDLRHQRSLPTCTDDGPWGTQIFLSGFMAKEDGGGSGQK